MFQTRTKPSRCRIIGVTRRQRSLKFFCYLKKMATVIISLRRSQIFTHRADKLPTIGLAERKRRRKFMLTCRKASYLVASLVLCLATTTPAIAGWQTTIERDDFGSDHVGLAITTAAGRIFGLRCKNGQVPTLIFATRETWADHLAEMSATLLIKIDEGEPRI